MLNKTNESVKLCVVLLIALASILMLFPSVSFAESIMIDLETDANGDGVSDELMSIFDELVETIEPQSQTRSKSEKITAELSADTMELYEKLGYSKSTMKRIEYWGELELMKAEVDSVDEVERIIKKQQRAESKIMSDSRYADVREGLQKIYELRYAEDAELESQTRSKRYVTPQRGQIMLSEKSTPATYAYALQYAHAGTSNGGREIYESDIDGVKLNTYSLNSGDWKDAVVLKHNAVAESVVQGTLTSTMREYGTGGETKYKWSLWDKWTEGWPGRRALYCSQLVWKMGKAAQVDLDSNPDWYLALMKTIYGPVGKAAVTSGITPEEIMWSSHTTTLGNFGGY